jgi:hypothetical protein
MRIRIIGAAGAVLVLALVGCSTSSDESPGTAEDSKYQQTWSTPYRSTTCGDYLTAMDDHQRRVLAADILVGARKADGKGGLPADADVDRFEQDMATACEAIATAKTTEIGASVYLVDTSYGR